MIDSPVADSRRYSAVLIANLPVRDLQDLHTEHFQCVGEQIETVQWRMSAAEFTADRNFYRTGPMAARQEQPSGGFSHRCWVAVSRTLPGRSAVLLAAPYSLLLETLIAHARALASDDLSFIRPNLSVAFDRFEIAAELARYRVSQITIQVMGQEAVELVTLTGKYPLRSKIREALFGEDPAHRDALARPYALAVQDARDRRSPRVHLDRHGNLWWFLSNDAAATAVTDVLGVFLQDSMKSETSVSPLKRRGIAGYEGE